MPVQRRDDHLLDLAAGKSAIASMSLADRGAGCVATFFFQVNLDDLAALFLRRQIDKEDFIKRPLRKSSGGRLRTSFAVAMTNTGAVFSCIQVTNVPNTREVVPPSDMFDEPVPERPFRFRRATKSPARQLPAVLSALRMFSSDAPTRPPKILPTSSRNSGICHAAPTAFGSQRLTAARHAQQQESFRRRQTEVAGFRRNA